MDPLNFAPLYMSCLYVSNSAPLNADFGAVEHMKFDLATLYKWKDLAYLYIMP